MPSSLVDDHITLVRKCGRDSACTPGFDHPDFVNLQAEILLFRGPYETDYSGGFVTVINVNGERTYG